MSTRCLINFSNDLEETKEGITIYKHWDGYPDNVLPLLKDFLKRNTREDIDYKSAGFLRYIQISEMDSVFDKEPFLSYGIWGNMDLFNDDLGWCDYVYVITKETIYILDSKMDLIKAVEVERLLNDFHYVYEVIESL